MQDIFGIVNQYPAVSAVLLIFLGVLKFGPEWIKVIDKRRSDKDKNDKNK
jgi:hypothetical protein